MINNMINNLEDLAYVFGTEPDIERIASRLYKSTDCGAWIVLNDNKSGVVIGSIVEGSDVDTETYELAFPFEEQDFWNCIEMIEGEAEMIWHEWNDDEDEDSNTLDSN